MPELGSGLLAAAILFVIIFVGWRLASYRHAIPCPEWLSWLVEIDNPFFKCTHADTIVPHLDLSPGMRALDAGCGPGRLTVPMAGKVGPAGRIQTRGDVIALATLVGFREKFCMGGRLAYSVYLEKPASRQRSPEPGAIIS